MNKTDKFKCVLCQKDFEGYGNNPEPIMSGKCCDVCNELHVIPARLGVKIRVIDQKRIKKLKVTPWNTQ